MILGAGIEQCIAIKEAQSLGYTVLACDSNPDAKGLSIAEKSEVVDITDVNQLIRLAKDYAINGVFCHAVEIPEIVAKVATSLGLPSLTPDTAALCTNKNERIQKLNEEGIPVSNYAFVSSKGRLTDLANKFGYPFILKPTSNAGSRGVQLIDNESRLFDAYDEAPFSNNSSVLLNNISLAPKYQLNLLFGMAV